MFFVVLSQSAVKFTKGSAYSMTGLGESGNSGKTDSRFFEIGASTGAEYVLSPDSDPPVKVLGTLQVLFSL